MKLTNISNYPVTVNGERIETSETVDLEIDDVEKFEDDRRFLLEDDDDASEDSSETSKPVKEKDNTGD